MVHYISETVNLLQFPVRNILQNLQKIEDAFTYNKQIYEICQVLSHSSKKSVIVEIIKTWKQYTQYISNICVFMATHTCATRAWVSIKIIAMYIIFICIYYIHINIIYIAMILMETLLYIHSKQPWATMIGLMGLWGFYGYKTQVILYFEKFLQFKRILYSSKILFLD